jgi:tetratricopeptide (TPR) repeat protein
VLRSGNRVRVTAQLIQAPTDQHLWARSYERYLRDVLALQDEVARAIANEIQVQLTPQEQARLASARAVNPEAHELYLKGRYYWNKRSGEDLKKSIEYFDQAIEKDPGYALAYTGLAASYSALSSYYLSPREAMPRAIAAAIKATELDSALAEAHTALGAVRLTYDWDTRAAERELKQAIALNPSSATAHDWYAQYLTVMGRQDEALAEIRRAQELDPLSLSISADQQLVLFMARRYDQAIEQCRKATDYAPSFYLPRAYLGLIYSQKRQFSEAIAELQKARELDDSPVILAFLAEAYALSGNRNQARKLRDELIAVAKHRYVCSYEVATVHVTLGEKEAAFKWFEKAHEDRSDCMIWLKVDPRLDGVRSDLRFPELLRRVGLPP